MARAYSSALSRSGVISGLEFPRDVHFNRFSDYIMAKVYGRGNLDVKAKPAMLTYGMKDHAVLRMVSLISRRCFPSAPVNTFENVGHLSRRSIPHILVPLVTSLFSFNPQGAAAD
jgi:hypothetical protein